MAEKKKSSTNGEKLVTKTELGKVTITTEENKSKSKKKIDLRKGIDNDKQNILYVCISFIVLVLIFFFL